MRGQLRRLARLVIGHKSNSKQFNLINSFGAEVHYAESFYSNTTRMSRFAPLSTEGGQLDGSGIDPAPEVPVRTDIDAQMDIFAKSLLINEQVLDRMVSQACYKFSVNTLEGLKAA